MDRGILLPIASDRIDEQNGTATTGHEIGVSHSSGTMASLSYARKERR